MSKEEIKLTTQLCKDVYQLVQVTYSNITFVKDDLQDRYTGLCNENTPVTDQLFGDDIKEKIKELDAEFSIGQKIEKNNREPGERTRRSFVSNNQGGRGFGRKHFTNGSSRNDNNDRKKGFLEDRLQKEEIQKTLSPKGTGLDLSEKDTCASTIKTELQVDNIHVLHDTLVDTPDNFVSGKTQHFYENWSRLTSVDIILSLKIHLVLLLKQLKLAKRLGKITE